MVITSDSNYVQHIENVTYWPRQIFNSNTVLIAIGAIGLAFTRFRDRQLLWTLGVLAAVLGFVRYYYFFTDHVFSHLGLLSGLPFSSRSLTHAVFNGARGRPWNSSNRRELAARTIGQQSPLGPCRVATLSLVILLVHMSVASAKVNRERYAT